MIELSESIFNLVINNNAEAPHLSGCPINSSSDKSFTSYAVFRISLSLFLFDSSANIVVEK